MSLSNMSISDAVRVAKMKLSGLHDPVIAELLPGAPRIATEVSELLDELLERLSHAERKNVLR